MVDMIIAQPIDYILLMLNNYVFGHIFLVGGFVLFLALLMCLANGIDPKIAILILIPLIVGCIGGGYLPSIFWLIPILFSSILWIGVFFTMLGIQKVR